MDVIGGGLLVAVAAALWIAYLMPTWLRRRQYLATEHNAVRLQQTLRILAETAETPQAVTLEATAREVATQRRILHEQEQAARFAAQAAEHAAIAERRAAEQAAESARLLAEAASAPRTPPVVVAEAASRAPSDAETARRALRRRRARCSLLLLAGVVTVAGGLVSAAVGAPLLVAGGGGVMVTAAVLGLARLARVRVPVDAAASVAPEAAPFVPIEFAEPEVVETHVGWTPRPLPRPLHLSRGTIAATAMASVEAAAELKRAAVDAEVARRVEQLEPAVPSIVPAPAATPAPSIPAAENPYARMGIVGDARPGIDDLDAVLRRRRRAG